MFRNLFVARAHTAWLMAAGFWATVGVDASAASASPRLSVDGGAEADAVDAPAHSFLGAAAELVVLDGKLEPGLGVRLRTRNIDPDPVLSGFMSVHLAARWLWWQPSAGWELELIGPYRPATSTRPRGSFTKAFHQAQERHVLWGVAVFEPLRFQFSRLLVAAASPRLSTPLDGAAGSRLVVGVSILRVGWLVEP